MVHCQTIRYASKIRAGRGFTLEELKEAGIPRKEARGVGIAVDFRRTNKSVESLQANVQRLKAYKAKLIVFPRRASKPKAGDADIADIKNVVQHTGPIMPIAQPAVTMEFAEITDAMKADNVYKTVRVARADARLIGQRQKRAEDKKKEKK